MVAVKLFCEYRGYSMVIRYKQSDGEDASEQTPARSSRTA